MFSNMSSSLFQYVEPPEVTTTTLLQKNSSSLIDFKITQYCSYFQYKSALMLLREQFCVCTLILT